jgi:hypothetical protein
VRPSTNTRVIKGRGTRRQLPAPRSSAAVAESTEKNVTDTSNRAVTCRYMSRYRVRFQPRRLGDPGDRGQDAPQYGDMPGWRTSCASS